MKKFLLFFAFFISVAAFSQTDRYGNYVNLLKIASPPKGDGTTNDRVAILNALKNYKSVFIPYTVKGYRIEENLNIPAGCRLVFDVGAQFVGTGTIIASDGVEVWGENTFASTLTLSGDFNYTLLYDPYLDTTIVNIAVFSPDGRLFPQPLASTHDLMLHYQSVTPTAYSTWVRDTTAQRLSPANANDKIIIGPGHENNYGVNQFMQGYYNITDSVYYMDKYPYYSTAVGIGSRVYDWYGFASGAGAVAEGKISAASNNHSLATVNDGTAEGNITVSGRMRFEAISHGTITHPIVGQCSYVIINWIYGDMTSMFPNLYTDNIETRYGTGANADARGNVNGAIHDTAVYNIDGTIQTANDLTWAMHTYCYIKGVPEGDMERYKILYASHATTGDTIFYDSYPEPFADIESIYSSYFAITADGKWNGGTGSHSEGWKTSAYGYGSHAEGQLTNAWGWAAHAQNRENNATGWYSNAAGYHSWSRRQGEDALANGYFTRRGDNQRSEYISKDTRSTSGVILALTDIEDSTSYYVETMVHGVQTSSTTGSEGEMFAYRFEYCVTRLGSTYTTVGTPIRTLIGRNVSDSGDGLTTGERIAWYGRYSTSDDFGVAFYGAGNRTFRIVCRSIWTEIKY